MLNLHTHINKNSISTMDILKVLQICDSSFPVGSFNHSYGMESYLRCNKINNTDTMREWINVYFKSQFIYSDALAIRMLYYNLENDDLNAIWELDRLITVQSIGKETRNGSKLVANRMIKLFIDLYDVDILKVYEKKIQSKEVYGHPAIVFGLLMHTLNLCEEDTIVFHMYSTVSTLIQNAVRAIPLGQKDGQLLLKEFSESFKELYEKVESIDYSLFGANSPGIELSQINHETLDFRLFMS